MHTPTTIFSREQLRRLAEQIISQDWDAARTPYTWEPRSLREVESLVEFAARKAIDSLVEGGLGYSADFISRQIETIPQCCYFGWSRCKTPALPHSIYCAEHEAEFTPQEDYTI